MNRLEAVRKYKKMYKQLLATADELAGRIESNDVLCCDITLAQPGALLNAVAKHVKEKGLTNVKQHILLDVYPYEMYQDVELLGKYTGVSWFSSGGARKAVSNGLADVMPCYYRDIPGLFTQYVDVDYFVAAVSPMDKHGYFSMSTVGSASQALLHKAKHIIVEVNKNLPRALNSPMVHISQIDGLYENHVPLVCLPKAEIDETSKTIGGLIAERIPDGATLQLGIGAVPDAVGLALKHKHDLGIHTEMFTDSMVELIECGAVNNSKKPIHTGKTVATFAFGSQRIYDLIDDNPAFELLPVDYVNDPAVIAQHPNFVSINAALEVDFYGQVCAESIGTKHVSGSGGQVDYVRGATQSPGGMSFIAFPSTAKGGTVSKIMPTLTPGAIVTTSKNDVDYIVTEFGIAKLRGKPLSERAKALISIAHPNFRDELTFAAKKQGILI